MVHARFGLCRKLKRAIRCGSRCFGAENQAGPKRNKSDQPAIRCSSNAPRPVCFVRLPSVGPSDYNPENLELDRRPSSSHQEAGLRTAGRGSTMSGARNKRRLHTGTQVSPAREPGFSPLAGIKPLSPATSGRADPCPLCLRPDSRVGGHLAPHQPAAARAGHSNGRVRKELPHAVPRGPPKPRFQALIRRFLGVRARILG